MKKLAAPFCLTVLFTAGCVTTKFTDKTMLRHNTGADYAYDLKKEELAVYVSKSKYQFFPDASAVIEECKSSIKPILLSISREKNIRTETTPVGGIQVTSGRNGLTGMTSCTGKAVFKVSTTKQITKKPPLENPPSTNSETTGSSFFVSKLGHIVTNEHVVRNCSAVTVGDSSKNQVTANVLETDKRNDLALLRISTTEMASSETKSLISRLGLKLVPLSSEGLVRAEDVVLGEDVLVSGYPYGERFRNTIKVTKGIVSANKGMGDDSGQFQMDAAVQSGSSGGPIYDENGNIVGVVVAQLNKLKVAKAIGSLPENVNFGINASTVRQFLTSAGLPTKWSNRNHRRSTKDLAKFAKNQTVMVVCNPQVTLNSVSKRSFKINKNTKK